MREELKMHNDSVSSAMLSFSDESRAFVEESTWDSETYTVHNRILDEQLSVEEENTA